MKLKDYFKKAQKEGWAIGHFNISNLETLRAIVASSQNLKSPVIIGTSEGEGRFIGLQQAVALVRSFREEAGLPIFLNLDHGKTLEYIKKAIDAGYDSVHFDGSALPLEENIKTAKEIVKFAHKKNVLVEGGVGEIGGELTDPAAAEKFIQETEIDSLAANIGTWHGEGEKTGIDFSRLKEIKERVGDKVFLVLHGGSGVPSGHIKQVIEWGISVIHISTELRLAFTSALRKSLQENAQETIPYKYMPRVVEAVQRVVEEKIKLFGSRNRN
ncbi:MAG: class II fructose-bisphosphate aldolase [Candidatus Wildermuthbacteria bacterium]|nr:class II fructose-bisphosphate aldolase [Candidatus Wildermuthbacteria bacterium]